MFIIPVPRLRGDLVAYFGARADTEHLIEVFCTCDHGLFILTEVETIRRRGLPYDDYIAKNPGRIPTAVDLSERVDQRLHELTTTPDRRQAYTLLLRHAQQRFAGDPSFCYGDVDTPIHLAFSQAPALPTELIDQALPLHPLLWQVGQTLDHLPYRLHRLVQRATAPALPQTEQIPNRHQRPRRRAS